jgi:Cu(I)/Ag(I) efflux system membrane fusion protein
MQLAGKPSLIDPTRAIASKQERKGPLEFEHVHVESVAGETGQQLERLYSAYFAIQQSLAGDEKPSEEQAAALHQQATALQDAADVSEPAREQLRVIATSSEHLHDMPIETARLEAFRPISHAVVRLASLVRSADATEPYSHMFCPMVKGGAGDWLQPNTELRNPYWGSQMLTCGEVVQTFPTKGHSAEESSDQHLHSADEE